MTPKRVWELAATAALLVALAGVAAGFYWWRECRRQLNAALVHALEWGGASTIHTLVRRGADIDTRDGYGHTALIWAAQRGNTALCEFLLDRRAHVNAVTPNGNTAIRAAVAHGNWPLIKRLVGSGASLNVGEPPLIEAERSGDLHLTEALLDWGALVDARYHGDRSGRTALMLAAAAGDLPMLRLLRRRGADPNLCDTANRITALAWAAVCDQPEAMQFLLDSGADASSPGAGGTALCLAARDGYAKTVDLLLARGVSVDARDRFGQTALMCAAWSGHLCLVRTLLRQGAAVRHRDQDGESALTRARRERHHRVVRLLRQHGAHD